MKRTMTTSEIAHELLNDENADWSYAGAYALAEFLEECEESGGEEMEFDRVAIRCEYSEFSSALEAASEYGFDPKRDIQDDAPDEEQFEAGALEWLQERTLVIEFDCGIIIQDF